MSSEKSIITSQMLNQTLIKRLIYSWMLTLLPSEGKRLEKLAYLHKCAISNSICNNNTLTFPLLACLPV